MKTLLYVGIGVIALGGMAMAAGTHSEGHGNNDPQMGGHSQSLGHGHDSNETGGHDDAMMAVGVPGDAAEVKRTIEVTMRETADGDMIFEPSSIEIHKNETIRFVVANAGDLTHEFVLDNHDGVIEHKALMERFPEMEHDDPNSVRLESGQSSELFWHFTNAGSFEFACLIPGHYAAGMKGDIAVSDQVASN